MKKKTAKILVTIIVLLCMLTGCAHEHTFSEATCTVPQTCSECGETEGEALGHSTDIGKCSRCEEIVNETLLLEINEHIGDGVVWLGRISTSGYSNWSLSDYYSFCLKSKSYLSNAAESFEKAIELCGNYSGLSSIKKDMNNFIDAVPNNVKGSDAYSITSFLNDMQECLLLGEDIAYTWADYAGKL